MKKLKMICAVVLVFTLAGGICEPLGMSNNMIVHAEESAEATTLDEIIELIEYIDSLDEADYTAESWEALMQVRNSITDPTQFPEAYQPMILEQLQKLVDGLEPAEPTTLDEIIELIEYIDSLNESDYTAESWEALMQVRNSITDPTQFPEAYQPMILEQLQKLVDGLEPAESTSGNYQLADGYYSVALRDFATWEKVTSGSLVNAPRTIGLSDHAMIKVENNEYSVTFNLTSANSLAYFGVLKEEYVSEGSTSWIAKNGTQNWIDGFDLNESSYNTTVKSGATEENNIYWKSYDLEKNETTGAVSITFQVEDLEKDIVVLCGNKTNNNLICNYISMNIYSAVNIDLEKFSSVSEISYEAGGSLGSYITSDKAGWTVDGNTAVGVFEIDTAALDSRYRSYTIYNESGETIDCTDGYIELTYDLTSYYDFSVGKKISLTGTSNNGIVTSLMTSIIPRADQNETVELIDEKTGVKIITDTSVVPHNGELISEEIVDDPSNNDDAYTVLANNIESLAEDKYMYNWKVQYENGTQAIRLSDDVEVWFKIPEEWDADRVQLASFVENYGCDPNEEGTIETTDDGSYFVISTNILGYFALYEVKDTSGTGEALTDGTYTVPLSVYHLTNEGQLSMADRCLGDNATIVVKDGEKYLFMDYTAVTQLNLTSYMTKMWLYGSDMTMNGNTPTGTLNSVIFTSYYMDEEGNYLTDDFNAGTLNYYPKEGYIRLVSDDAQWPARFKVPIMDAIGGGNFEQDAWLTLDWANAEKISDDTPDAPIKEALGEMISIAETAVQEEYTQDSWDALESAYNTAKEVYGNESADAAQMEEAYTSLRDAVDSLETPQEMELDAGLYTATGTLGEGNAVNGTRILAKEDGADIRLDVQGIQTFLYYDINEGKYVEAELETVEDEEGNQSVTKAEFSLATMTDTVSVRYQTTDNEVVTTTLTFTDYTKQEVDKEALVSIIDEANTLLEQAAEDADAYDAEKVAALQSAVAMASAINEDRFAVQSETDAQVEAVEAAISDLTVEVNLDELRAMIAEAETIDASLYTPESFQTVQDAITEAQNLLEQENITGQQAEAQLLKLSAAIEGLIERADKTKLQAAYDEAAAIQNNGYAGWEDLQTVLNEAKAVLDDANATQAEVDAQISAINAAVDNLTGGIDKSALEDIISQAESLNTDGYSDESIAFFQAAINSAKEVMASSSATQQEVDKQIQLLEATSAALIQKQQENTVYDGVYTMDAVMRHAAADQDSMGNAALVKPIQLIKDGDQFTLRMEFVPLTTSVGTSGFTGYLAVLNYFPDWEGGESGYEMPTNETPVSANIESYYEDVYDSYNDPETGTDENIKGQLYPHYMTIPVELNDNEIWVQVYVPVMEAINTGSGLQYAKLQLDWNSLEQISGTETDKSELQSITEEAASLLEELEDNAEGFSDAKIEVLRRGLVAAEAVNSNLNVAQSAVDATVNAMQKTINVFTVDEVVTDKSDLLTAIETADSYLNDEDVTYTASTLAILQRARDNAQEVYDNEQATQTQINNCIAAIESAIQGLAIDGTDKRELKEALELAESYLKNTDSYSAAALEALRSLYDGAIEVYEGEATQEQIDAQVRILNYAVKSLTPVEEADVDKSGLHSMLVTAANLAGRDNLYTDESIDALLSVIQEAEAVYQNNEATQKEVNEQASILSLAILALEAKPAETPGTGTGDGESGNDNNDDGNNGGNTDLDIENLADGVYSIYGEMVKTDKTSESMSNAAINHTLKLTVEDGKYYITMNFNGLQYAGQYGYLKDLQYFLTGYTTNQYGVPQGDLADVTIDSYQTDDDGNRVSDSFGTDYPDYVTFELIPEALEDGFVPLQVFVPIMESIADGTGTQAVYLKLDWSTLKLTSSDDPDFEDDGNNDNNNDNGDDGNNGGSGLTGGSSLTGGSTLGTSSLGGSSLGSSSLGGSSLGSSSLKSGSGLSSASSVKTDDTTAGYGGFAALLAIGCMAVLAGVMQRRTQKKDKETV